MHYAHEGQSTNSVQWTMLSMLHHRLPCPQSYLATWLTTFHLFYCVEHWAFATIVVIIGRVVLARIWSTNDFRICFWFKKCFIRFFFRSNLVQFGSCLSIHRLVYWYWQWFLLILFFKKSIKVDDDVPQMIVLFLFWFVTHSTICSFGNQR